MSSNRDIQEILANLNRRLGEAKRFQKTVTDRIKKIDKELAALKAKKAKSR